MLPQQLEMQLAAPESSEERLLVSLLSHEPVHIDELILASRLPAPTVTATLTMLELKGLAKALARSQFVLAR